MLKILPPIWFFLFLIAAFLVDLYIPALRLFDISNSIIANVIGIILLVAGMTLSLQASKLFRENNTEILPTSPTNRALIVTGPYRFTRNPMYLGMVLSLLGISFYIGIPTMFLVPLAQFLALHFVFIPFEESKMERQFGESFLAYKKLVRRWI